MGVQEKRMGILYICIITNEMEYYMNISLKAMFFSRSILLYHSVLVKFIGLWICHIAVIILPFAGWTLSSGL